MPFIILLKGQTYTLLCSKKEIIYYLGPFFAPLSKEMTLIPLSHHLRPFKISFKSPFLLRILSHKFPLGVRTHIIKLFQYKLLTLVEWIFEIWENSRGCSHHFIQRFHFIMDSRGSNFVVDYPGFS